MIITGNKIRSIYPQVNINWQKICTPFNIDGYYNFYFSGQNANELIFQLKNNKIYSKNNDFVGGFNLNENINFSGNVTNTTIDLYKNGEPLYLGVSRNQTGNLLGFFITSQNSTLNIDSLSILGDQPDYYFNSNITYNSGDQIPINLRNSGQYPIIIYSGEIVSNNYSISGVNNLVVPATGSSNFFIINNGTFSNGVEIVNINLFSNIGTESLYINLSGTLIEDNLFYINISPPTNTIFNGENFIYNLSFANASGSNIEISLEYNSGITGDYYRNVQTTGYLTGIVSGIVSGQGFIQNNLTGSISGFNSLRNGFEFGTGSGLFSAFKIADNQLVSGFYQTIATGKGDVNFTTNILASGYKDNVLYSGFLNYQGGFLTGFATLPGTGFIFNQQKTGLINGIHTIFKQWTGNIIANFNPDEYELVNLSSPVRYVVGNFYTGLTLLGFGFATGIRKSGKLQADFGSEDYDPGIYNFSIPFSGKVSGFIQEATGFEPIEVTYSPTEITGFVSTIINQQVIAMGCKIDLDFGLTGTGIPQFPRKLPNGVPYPVSIFPTLPVNKAEYIYENSNFVINSGNISIFTNQPTGGRTRISRLGNTINGTGIFDNLFQESTFTGNQFITGLDNKKTGYARSFFGWKETIPSTSVSKIVDLPSNKIIYSSGQYNLFNIQDFSEIDFTVTGKYSDLNTFKLRFDTNRTGTILINEVYQNDFESGKRFSGINIGEVFGNRQTISGNVDSPLGVVSGYFSNNITGFWSTGNVVVLETGTRIRKLITIQSGGLFNYNPINPTKILGSPTLFINLNCFI
jgi:hypothetical protein